MPRDAGQTDSSLQISRSESVLYVLLPVLIAFATGVRRLAGVMDGGLINPDSYMRMVRLAETLQSGQPAYLVERDGSGAGTLLHWSHLIDSVLCVLALPFRLAITGPAALHAAAVAFGPLSLGALGLALAWAVTPVAEPRWRWLAPVAVALSGAIVSYGLPGVVHHHVLLVLVAVMIAGHALRGVLGLASPGAGLAIGAWAGVGIWLSPEAMPFVLMTFGGLWLAWVLQVRQDLLPMIGHAAGGFALVAAAAFAVDPPRAGYAAVEIDRLSTVYLWLALVIVMMAGAAACIDRARPAGMWRMVSGIGVPLVVLGAWVALFPALLDGTGGLLSAKETQAMFGGISEMMPVRSFSEGIQLLLPGILTAGALAWMAAVRRSLLLGYVALCACVLVVLGAMHLRFTAYPAAAAAGMLPILLTRCGTLLADRSEALQAGTRIALLALFALVPRMDGFPGLFSPATAAPPDDGPTCALADGAALLAEHAGAVVLASPNDTPELLYRSQVLTVGSLYHRNAGAFMRLRAAWRSMPSGRVPDAVRATGATLLLFCAERGRSLMVADLPADTLYDRLNRDQIPPWLRRLGNEPRSGHVLYEVMP